MRHKQVDDTVVIDKSPLHQCPTLREPLLQVPLIVGEKSQLHSLTEIRSRRMHAPGPQPQLVISDRGSITFPLGMAYERWGLISDKLRKELAVPFQAEQELQRKDFDKQ
jgi:hypothetical protein